MLTPEGSTEPKPSPSTSTEKPRSSFITPKGLRNLAAVLGVAAAVGISDCRHRLLGAVNAVLSDTPAADGKIQTAPTASATASAHVSEGKIDINCPEGQHATGVTIIDGPSGRTYQPKCEAVPTAHAGEPTPPPAHAALAPHAPAPVTTHNEIPDAGVHSVSATADAGVIHPDAGTHSNNQMSEAEKIAEGERRKFKLLQGFGKILNDISAHRTADWQTNQGTLIRFASATQGPKARMIAYLNGQIAAVTYTGPLEDRLLKDQEARLAALSTFNVDKLELEELQYEYQQVVAENLHLAQEMGRSPSTGHYLAVPGLPKENVGMVLNRMIDRYKNPPDYSPENIQQAGRDNELLLKVGQVLRPAATKDDKKKKK